MASTQIQAFLGVEGTVQEVLADAWEKHAKRIQKELKALIKEGKFQEAHRVADQISFEEAVESLRDRLIELGISAMLLGADRISSARESKLMRQPEIPEVLTNSVNMMIKGLVEQGSEKVRRQAHIVIDIQEEKFRAVEKADLDTLLKADVSKLSLAAAMNAAVNGTGKGLVDVAGNLTTSRLVSYGFLAEAVDRGVAVYQVSEVLDSRTCPVCQFMHGKEFRVDRAIARLDNLLRMTNPDDLKAAAPFPKQTKAAINELYNTPVDDLQARGLDLPPYHPGCRGQPVRRGTVTEVASLPPTLSVEEVPVALAPVQVPGSRIPQQVVEVFDDVADKGAAKVYSYHENGKRFFVKQTDPQFIDREVAVSRFAKEVDLDEAVPETFRVKAKIGERQFDAVATPFLHDATSLDKLDFFKVQAAFETADDSIKNRLLTFNYLAGVNDRSLSNYMWNGKAKQLISIDHELALNPMTLPLKNDELARQGFTKVVNETPKILGQDLEYVLDKSELRKVLKKKKPLLKIIEEELGELVAEKVAPAIERRAKGLEDLLEKPEVTLGDFLDLSDSFSN